MRILAGIALLAVGCGRLGFDTLELDPTAPNAPDAPAAGAPSGLSVGEPTIPLQLASSSSVEARPFASSDMRELYFVSDRAGGKGAFDIWCAKRTHVEDPWGAPQPVVEVNTVKDETGAAISNDGLSLWLSTSREGGFGGTDLWIATRSRVDGAWSQPTHVPELSSGADDDAPAWSADGREVVFHSTRIGGSGRRDLWRSTRESLDAEWRTPEPLVGLNTAKEDADPFLTVDGDLLFDSNRSADYRELYIARRTTDGFAAPVRVDAFDSERADADPWLSPDGTYLIFVSSRTGDDEIFEVLLPAPL